MVILLVLLCFSISLAFFPTNQYINLVYSALGCFVFGMFIVYDTQLMLGGNHRYSVSPEEYIFCALNLYLDIVNIFIYILNIINFVDN